MNTPHVVAYAVSAVLMIAIPFPLAVYLARRLHARWNTWLLGMVTFVAAQVVHLPVLGVVMAALHPAGKPLPTGPGVVIVDGLVLGLLAGVCEEGARWLMLRLFARHARRWRDGLMFGAGHGAAESIITGAGLLSTLAGMIALPAALGKLPADQVAAVQAQADAFWSTPLLTVQAGWIERILAICVHLACALLVLEAVRRHNARWLLYAVGFHAALDAAVVMAASHTWVAEGIAALFAVAALAIVKGMHGRDLPGDVDASAEAPTRQRPASRRS